MDFLTYLRLIFVSILICSFSLISAEEDPGVLIVTYKTDKNGERLDRIHFWLINSSQEQSLHPKPQESTESEDSFFERKVVIHDLPPGNYQIKFLVPNADQFFAYIPPKDVKIQSNGITNIDQEISTLKKTVNKDSEAGDKDSDVGLIITNYPPPFYDGYPYTYPYDSTTFPPVLAPFSLKSNIPYAHWRIMQYGNVVYAGQGTVNGVPIPSGHDYFIKVEHIPGYRVQVTPQNRFDIDSSLPFKAEIYYQQELGFLDLEAELPTGESVTVLVVSKEGKRPPVQMVLTSKQGRVSWNTIPLPVGEYTISFQLPPGFVPTPPERFLIQTSQHVLLTPFFTSASSLLVKTNSPEASFLLKSELNGTEWKGQGSIYTFKDLQPGHYLLTFLTSNDQIYTPPAPQRITIPLSQKIEVTGNYSMKGKIVISSNVDNFSVVIQSLSSSNKNAPGTIIESITGRSKTIWLPEGPYEINFQPLDAKSMTRKALNPPPSIKVEARAFHSQSIYEEYLETSALEKKQQPQQQPNLTVNSNNPQAKFVLVNLSQFSSEKYQGKLVSLKVPPGEYRIDFENLPHYNAPESITVTIEAEGNRSIQADYTPKDVFLEVPAGEAILGDPFQDDQQNTSPSQRASISTFWIDMYEVTNLEYATWLNKAFKDGSIKWHPDKPGYLIDQEGHLLGKTFEANPLSQISSQKNLTDTTFAPIPGKDLYPVIEVSWFGATAYAKGNGFRLPTEAEWEKAAGMSLPTSTTKKKRFRYGFGQDIIDPSWANYKKNNTPITSQQVKTTPVGFYNGMNQLPLTLGERSPVQTHDAKSPIGAYDMSGNVWEWVSDWYAADRWQNSPDEDPQGPSSGTQKVAKGGCYDSLSEGVRVSERMPLNPEYSDIYTGFRVVKR